MKKACLFFVELLMVSSVWAAQLTPHEIVEGTRAILEARDMSDFNQGWIGATGVYLQMISFPECWEELFAYVEGSLDKADSWSQVIPLYLQIGGDVDRVVSMLPRLKNPESIALANIYLMIHNRATLTEIPCITNRSDCVEATLRQEDGSIVVSLKNVDRNHPVLLAKRPEGNLRIWRTDGVDIPSHFYNPTNRKLDNASVIVLNPGDRYEFNIGTELKPESRPKYEGFDFNRGIWHEGGGLLAPNLWRLDGVVVASSLSGEAVPLTVQFVYDASLVLPQVNPEVLASYRQMNENLHSNSSPLRIDDVGVVASKPLEISLPIAKPQKGSPVGSWYVTGYSTIEREEVRKWLDGEIPSQWQKSRETRETGETGSLTGETGSRHNTQH